MKNQVVAVLANKIHETRNEKGVSQAELAKRSGFDETYVSKIERGMGNPSMESMVRLGEELEMPFTEFFK